MKLKRSSMITKIVVFALVLYAAASLITMRARIDEARAEQDAIKKQVAEKEVSNAELEYQIRNSDDDEVIANIARADFGLVMPGEIMFFDGNGNPDSAG